MNVVKERITVSVDAEVVAAAERAVAAGRASSVSAWVNAAMARSAGDEERRERLADAVAAYEAEFGAFTEEEIEAYRVDRAKRVIRSKPKTAAEIAARDRELESEWHRAQQEGSSS